MNFPIYINKEDIDWFYEYSSHREKFDIFVTRLLGHASSEAVFDDLFIATKGCKFSWALFLEHCLMSFSIKKELLRTKKEMDERSDKVVSLSRSIVNILDGTKEDNPMWVLAHSLERTESLEFYNVDLSIFNDNDRRKAEVLNLMSNNEISFCDIINLIIDTVNRTRYQNTPVVSQPNRKNAEVIFFCREMVSFFRHHLDRPLFSVVATLVNILHEVDYDVQDVRDSLRGYTDNSW
ncbi:hypothetical protein EYY93_10155 [Hafnia paralvei]|uniref:hypothetical protein n=1 Tax=Hafnia paralvei TaxID=546367 RepID=UPI001033848B|nr:hypothetical protein [Hafnia paralvei]TBM01164.1 hypothetical protein EYY93_10155 [Hafnia paralvei]